MKKLEIFKQEHFIHRLLSHYYHDPIEISKTANIIFNDYLASNGKIVFGRQNSWLTCNEPGDTHTAYLIAIEPIKECSHKEAVMVEQVGKSEIWFECDECGKRLIPLTWKVDE